MLQNYNIKFIISYGEEKQGQLDEFIKIAKARGFLEKNYN
jgi:hypothetical protein